MNDLREKVSYAVGMSIAESLKSQQLDKLDLNLLKDGIHDVFTEKEFKVNPGEANDLIKNYLDEANTTVYGENKQKGIDFLNENKKRSEVQTTTSGLQYEVITDSDGASPKNTDTVSVHYHGTLIDGTIFDSSVDRGTPASFGVHQVIPGWTEALQLMTVGSKYRLYIPQEIAYGANPHPGGPIEPFSALIFDVDLLSIQ
jgi:FKBP-type peptidyl-prolyl cis-trans isomerase FklB